MTLFRTLACVLCVWHAKVDHVRSLIHHEPPAEDDERVVSECTSE